MEEFRLTIKTPDTEEGSRTSDVYCSKFLIVGWTDGGTKLAVHHSDPGNLEDVELVCRTLAKMLKNSESGIYSFLGALIESSLENGLKHLEKQAGQPKLDG